LWTYPFAEPDRLLLHPRYAYLREHQPLARVKLPYGVPAWLVTRYDDARAALADPRLRRAVGGDEPRTTPEIRDSSLLSRDPPEHTARRRLVAQVFATPWVERLRPQAERVADELVDAMITAGPPADLVASFAVPFPLAVVAELFGIPPAASRRIPDWTRVHVATTALSTAKLREYQGRLGIYMTRLVKEYRRGPGAGAVLGALVEAGDAGRIDLDELITFAVDLLAMGYENTAMQLANFAYTLLTEPVAVERLRAGPGLVRSAVEELTRYVPIAAHAAFPRFATADVELASGVVRAGEAVLVSLAAADRDERVFAEPEHLDLARGPNPHLGYGHGLHHCLGAPLARMELQVALTTLVRRLPGLRLAVPADQVGWKAGLIVRGPVSLPVTWACE
jgi:cytochrome P450